MTGQVNLTLIQDGFDEHILRGGGNILLDAFFKNGKVLPGLSREMVLAYMEIARKAIADGHNTTGSQTIRLQQLEELIKTLK